MMIMMMTMSVKLVRMISKKKIRMVFMLRQDFTTLLASLGNLTATCETTSQSLVFLAVRPLSPLMRTLPNPHPCVTSPSLCLGHWQILTPLCGCLCVNLNPFPALYFCSLIRPPVLVEFNLFCIVVLLAITWGQTSTSESDIFLALESSNITGHRHSRA